MIIGIDVDGTLCQDAFIAPDKLGIPAKDVVYLVQMLHQDGHELYIWTCRADYVVRDWLIAYDLMQYFKGINCSPNAVSDSAKPSFDYYIGDDAMLYTKYNAEEIYTFITEKGDARCLPESERDKDFMSAAPVPYLAGTGSGYIRMFEQAWQQEWLNHFPCGKDYAFMTICSHAKPYSKSYIHGCIREELHAHDFLRQVDYIHISNAGIIPSGSEMNYPFNAYDHDGSQMSPSIQQLFQEVTEHRIHTWANLFGNKYKHIFVYLRRGKTWAASQGGLSVLEHVTFIEARKQVLDGPQLPFMRLHDPDDQLTDWLNLEAVVAAMKHVIVARNETTISS